MPKSKSKSIKKADAHQELINLKFSLQAVLEQVNQEIDGIIKRLDRLTPADDTTRYQKHKNYTPQDWRNYLKS
jgi:hypothetical protein